MTLPRPTRRAAGRSLAALFVAGLAGACGGSTPILNERIAGTPVSVVLAGASIASFVALERGIFDVGYSLVTGKDCSLVHIERRGEYCRTEAVEPPTPFCTRSLGGVDCWTVTNPYGSQQPVADRPSAPERRHTPWALSPF